jgi:hypothetical protein
VLGEDLAEGGAVARFRPLAAPPLGVELLGGRHARESSPVGRQEGPRAPHQAK